jgi:hypothetical protein
MLHQFEEHGVDAQGKEYAFREYLCGFLGFTDVDSCPVTPSFLFAGMQFIHKDLLFVRAFVVSNVNLYCLNDFLRSIKVNVGTVWIMGLIAGLGAPRHSLFPGSMFGLMFVNALVHIRPAILDWEYNPGLVTAAALLLPLSVFALYSMYMRGLLRYAVQCSPTAASVAAIPQAST